MKRRREVDEYIQSLAEAVKAGREVYISFRRVRSIEIVPSKQRYKVRVVFEDGSELVEYPSLLVKRHIEVR